MHPVRAVILAGGSGTRLWPLSRQQLPKQFLRLNGERSLLEETVQRLRPLVEPSEVLVVTNEGHARGEAYSALLPYRTLLEPEGRNTAPAIAVAAALLAEEGGDPVMVVLPADHVIRDVPAFQQVLARAIDAAAAGRLVTFAIRPDRADTGFGYIKARGTAGPVMEVECFVEKPDRATAERLLAEGGYFWNSGMFVWRASVILAEIGRHLPQVAAVLEDMRAAWNQGASAEAVMKSHFSRMPGISIDHGVLEKSSNVALVPCDIGWSDVGSWDAIHDIADKDAQGNAIQGAAIALDCRNTLIRGGKRIIAAIGLEDLCIVETPDAILIAKRGQTQRVREVVDALAARQATQHLVHLTVNRPWGRYTVLDDEEAGFKIKRIEIRPGGRLSLQRHQHRSEHWVVVSGTATVTRDGETYMVAKNESTYIPIGVKHRLENRGKVPLQIVEVQVGEYTGEDDIERFGDQYGRVEK